MWRFEANLAHGQFLFVKCQSYLCPAAKAAAARLDVLVRSLLRAAPQAPERLGRFGPPFRDVEKRLLRGLCYDGGGGSGDHHASEQSVG